MGRVEHISTQLTIVVATFNRAKLLELCLKSLEAQTLDRGLYEVIIVDNNSSDNTAKICEVFTSSNPNFRYTTEVAPGPSNARNTGWKLARGNYVAFMDDDGCAHPDWASKILTSFETVSPKPIAIGGKIIPRFEKKTPWWFSPEIEMRSWGETPHFLTGEVKSHGFAGSNMALSKTDVLLDPVFSPKLGLNTQIQGGEDTYIFLQLSKQNGDFWYDPDIIVYHWTAPHKISFVYQIKRSFQSGKTFRFIADRPGSFPIILKMIFSILIRVPIVIFFLLSIFYTQNALKYGKRIAWLCGFMLSPRQLDQEKEKKD